MNKPSPSVVDNAFEISFVLPCLNEARTIAACVKECLASLERAGVTGEVVVADNGSIDGSAAIAAEAGARVVTVTRRGYGSTLLGGIRAAHGKYALIGDSDLSYDFSQMPRFLEKLREGYDLVMGCRMPRGGGTIQPKAMPWLHRRLGNPFLSWLGRVFFRTNILDFHCGIRAFNRQRLLTLNLQTSGMEFASEMVVKATLARFRMAQVPVTLRRDARDHPAHLRTWRDGWRHLRFMVLYAPRWLFLYPGLVATIVSAIGFFALLLGPIKIGSTRFDTNSLLMAAMGILVGFQIILFGLFSELFCCRFELLPRTKLTDQVLSGRPFERGIFIGAPLFALGFLCLLLALAKWKSANFGDLSYPDTLRLTIPALTGMCLGVQVIFGGFLLAVLGLNSSSPEPPPQSGQNPSGNDSGLDGLTGAERCTPKPSPWPEEGKEGRRGVNP